MAPKRLLITGASSFIGFYCLIKALKDGYDVCCAVRSQSKLELVRSTILEKFQDPGDKLTFSIISNFTDKKTWLDNLAGVDYVIHLATPKPGDQFDNDRQFVQTAVEMTTSILQAAIEIRTIKRVVITSSMVAISSGNKPISAVSSENTRLPPYAVSKIEALKAIDAFIENQNPGFPIISVFPGWVIGRNDLVSTPQDLLRSSNFLVLLPLVGNKPIPLTTNNPLFSTIHIQDVADLHLGALGPEIQGHCSIVAAGLSQYERILPIVKEHFPEAMAMGKFTPAELPSALFNEIDSYRAKVDVYGCSFRSFEEQVVGAVGQYLELLD